MTNKLKYFAASPLRRHPRLLARKVLQRLGLGPRFRFTTPPPGLRWRQRPEWSSRLRTWVDQCELSPTPYSWTRVFKQDFDAEFLLTRCSEGPLKTADLRGDIKLIWEFSRLHALFLNAAAKVDSGSAEELRLWLDANSDPNGLNWINAMEVAIRAVNLTAANALAGDALRKHIGEETWLHWLWNHACAIEARLEAKILSSNHYLADLLGLAVICSHLDGHPRAERLRLFAQREFQAALASQTLGDGGAYEASLPYHALITEMALLFASLPDNATTSEFRETLRNMCRIVANMTNTDGDVFRFGDDDGGRVLPVDFASQHLGRAQVLGRLAESVGIQASPSQSGAVYPDSGWARLTAGPWTLAAEFGGYGFHGLGAHAHHDTLSFCLNYTGRPVIIDPGSYIYSADPEARRAFRATAAHNTISIAGREHTVSKDGLQGDLFRLPGPEQPARITQHASGRLGLVFQLPGSSLTLHRTFMVKEDGVEILDKVEGAGAEELEWNFQFDAKLKPVLRGSVIVLDLGGGKKLNLQPPEDLEAELGEGQASPFYGTRQSSLRATLRARVTLPFSAIFRINVARP